MKGTMEAPKAVESITEEDLDDEISKAYADRSAAKKAAKSNPDEGPERRVMVEDRIKKLEARKQQLEGAPAAPAVAATPAKIEQRRAPDGSIWEFDTATKKPLRKVQ